MWLRRPRKRVLRHNRFLPSVCTGLRRGFKELKDKEFKDLKDFKDFKDFKDKDFKEDGGGG